MERYSVHLDAAVYYPTYWVVEWLPVFVSQASCCPAWFGGMGQPDQSALPRAVLI